MLIARSLVFNLLFYLNIVIWMLAVLPTLYMPYRCIVEVAKAWGRCNNWILRVICGTHVEVRGLEKVPWGPILVASKHQSMWETFALLGLFQDPAFILKRELNWIPVFGWFTQKGRMIPVNRGARGTALLALARDSREELARGRQIIIFPEGTRRPAGAEPRYKFGVAHLYAETGVPCLPVALNSGLYWPRRSFLRFPGTIRVEILDPIPPGLGKHEFAERLRDNIEAATARLIAEGERELAALGFAVPKCEPGTTARADVPPEDAVRSPDSPTPPRP